jgi:DNA-binding FrmR family transcriptional regulator
MCPVLASMSMHGGVMLVIVTSRRPGRVHVVLSAAVGLFLLGGSRCRGHLYFSVAEGLYHIPGRGIYRLMRKDIKLEAAKRLTRIEGQVRGLARMVEEDRYCIDIVTQIAATRAALRRLEEQILKDHVGHCVEHAIDSGNKAEQRRKIEELMAVVSRADR